MPGKGSESKPEKPRLSVNVESARAQNISDGMFTATPYYPNYPGVYPNMPTPYPQPYYAPPSPYPPNYYTPSGPPSAGYGTPATGYPLSAPTSSTPSGATASSASTPPTAFSLFCKDMLPRVQAERPHWDYRQLWFELSRLWKQLDPSDQEVTCASIHIIIFI
jgi:hypothetical protein